MVDHNFVDLLSAELTVCTRLIAELMERKEALRAAKLSASLGVDSDIIGVHLRKVVPSFLVETRCEQCERHAVFCACPV